MSKPIAFMTALLSLSASVLHAEPEPSYRLYCRTGYAFFSQQAYDEDTRKPTHSARVPGLVQISGPEQVAEAPSDPAYSKDQWISFDDKRLGLHFSAHWGNTGLGHGMTAAIVPDKRSDKLSAHSLTLLEKQQVGRLQTDLRGVEIIPLEPMYAMYDAISRRRINVKLDYLKSATLDCHYNKR